MTQPVQFPCAEMKVSIDGLKLIRNFEGFRAKAYVCPAGKLTIGIGTVIDTPGESYLTTATITEEEAYELLRKDVAKMEAQVIPSVKVALTQNQWDAIMSLVYNIGTGAFNKSTVLRVINSNGDPATIKKAWLMWVKAAGKTLPGLVLRREKELEHYFKS